MKIGDIVEPVGRPNWSVHGRKYTRGIVCCLDPVIVVAEDASIGWRPNISEMRFVEAATPELTNRCMQILSPEHQSRMDVGVSVESLSPKLRVSQKIGCGLHVYLADLASPFWIGSDEDPKSTTYHWIFLQAPGRLWKPLKKVGEPYPTTNQGMTWAAQPNDYIDPTTDSGFADTAIMEEPVSSRDERIEPTGPIAAIDLLGGEPFLMDDFAISPAPVKHGDRNSSIASQTNVQALDTASFANLNGEDRTALQKYIDKLSDPNAYFNIPQLFEYQLAILIDLDHRLKQALREIDELRKNR